MTKVVLKKREKLLGRVEIWRDMSRNAHLIPEASEPTFTDTMKVPAGAKVLRVKTKRCRITLEFL